MHRDNDTLWSAEMIALVDFLSDTSTEDLLRPFKKRGIYDEHRPHAKI